MVEAGVVAKYCGHGVVQRVKLGFDLSPEGWEICKACGLPTFESVQRAGRSPARYVDGSDGPPVLVVTTNDLPGYRIDEVFGDVFGVTVRSPNMFMRRGSVFGGEMGGLTGLVLESRREVRERLMAAARVVGANAVIATRFYSSEVGEGTTEVGAYGTAVTVTKLP